MAATGSTATVCAARGLACSCAKSRVVSSAQKREGREKAAAVMPAMVVQCNNQ